MLKLLSLMGYKLGEVSLKLISQKDCYFVETFLSDM